MSRTDYVSLRPFTVALVLVIGVNVALAVAGIAGAALTGWLAWLPAGALVVASSLWVYRVHRNARALGATGLRFSAGGAAALLVIPFANIYASRMIYQELWMRCAGTPEQPSRLVVWWWRVFVFGLVLSLGLGIAGGFKPALQALAMLALRVYPFTTLALYVVLVLAIAKRQTAAHKRHLALSDAAAPVATGGPLPRLTFVNLEAILGVTLLALLGLVILGASAALGTLEDARHKMRVMNLKQLYNHALMAQVHGELPESVGPTPPLGACCTGRCRADWQHPSWRALDFSSTYLRESYEFVRIGDDFKVVVYADRDCDGIHARLELSSKTGIDAVVEENPSE